eukprot:173369-Prymnesium_polylepis.1
MDARHSADDGEEYNKECATGSSRRKREPRIAARGEDRGRRSKPTPPISAVRSHQAQLLAEPGTRRLGGGAHWGIPR